MNFRPRLLAAGLALFVLVAFLALRQGPSSAVAYTGLARAENGALVLEVFITPPISRPGETLQLTAQVYNRGPATISPNVILRLPAGIEPNVADLRSGATVNLPANELNWLPVVAPNGGVESITISLPVVAADLVNPERDVKAILRHQGMEVEAVARLWIGIPPLIRDVAAQTQAAVGQEIALEPDVMGPGPMQYLWRLGDGRQVEIERPVVVFGAAGQYEVTLEVRNPAGSATYRKQIVVVPQPAARFVPDDDSPGSGQVVVFQNKSGGQPPLQFNWDFGDGVTVADVASPTHRYEASGSYQVRLTVDNEFGRSEAFWTIVVSVPPVADMVIPDNAAVGQKLQGQAFGDESVTAFRWDMGDGRTYEGATVSHVFRLPGDYYVSLTAINPHGETRVGRWVRVGPGITTLFIPAIYQPGEAVAAFSADLPDQLMNPVPVPAGGTFALPELAEAAGMTPAEALFAYINEARRLSGLPALAYSLELSAAAQQHNLDKAAFPTDPHIGGDGTTPAERLLRSGYRGGYGGEATAWGFPTAREAVEFWMNSEPHRVILLNQYAGDLGVSFIEDYGTRNVWHWTAEFGTRATGPVEATLRLQTPANGTQALNSEFVNYSWVWPLPLASDQRFVVYLWLNNRAVALGMINQPVYGSRYLLSADALRVVPAGATDAQIEWQVKLEDGRGAVLAESGRQTLLVRSDTTLIAATPLPILTPTAPIVTATPEGGAPPTSTPTIAPPAPTQTPEAPPVIVTATPSP